MACLLHAWYSMWSSEAGVSANCDGEGFISAHSPLVSFIHQWLAHWYFIVHLFSLFF